MYNTNVHFSQGGSSLEVESGGAVHVALSGSNSNAFQVGDGTRTATLSVGRNVPTFTASPGSLYIRSDGSVSGFYVNKSSGTSGSLWAAASLNAP